MLWHGALRVGGCLQRCLILARPQPMQHWRVAVGAEDTAQEFAHDRYRAVVVQHECWQRRLLRDTPPNANTRQRGNRLRQLP